MQRKCSGIRKCRSKVDFESKKCFGFTSNAEDDGDETLYGDVIRKGTKLSYLQYVLSSEGGVQEAVTVRIRSKWKKYKDIASVLCKRVVALKL